jgi:hypothetical protein
MTEITERLRMVQNKISVLSVGHKKILHIISEKIILIILISFLKHRTNIFLTNTKSIINPLT